jgi:hypothetical protein
MNQRFRALQELGEQFERALAAGPTDQAQRHGSHARAGLARILHVAPGAIAVTFSVSAAIAIALVALVFVRPAHRSPTPNATGNTEASLIAHYAALRRPQTAADRTDAGPAPRLGGTSTFGGGQGTSPGVETLHYSVHVTGLGRLVDLPALTRVVSVGGVRVSLFVEHGVPSHTLPKATVTGNDSKDAASLVTPQALRKLQRRSNAGAGYYLIARVGRAGRIQVIEGPGTSLTTARARRFAAQSAGLRGVNSSSLSGPHDTIVAVVPDGIARITWGWPREFDSQTLTYVPPATTSAPVQNNVAVAAAPARFTKGEKIGPETVIRYAADGSVLARFTDQSNSASVYQNTTYTSGVPGPETAQSRRAEHDPATPNRVVIIPTAVTLRSIRFGPGPQFFFKALLNHRIYFIRVTGGPHPSCIKSNPRLSDGTSNGADLRTFAQPTVRGDTFSGGVAGSVNISCRGVYRLSVSVLNSHNQPYPPFGSATFSIR